MSRERNTEIDLSAFDSKKVGHIDLNSFGSTITPKSGSAGEIAKILQQLEALKEAEKYEGFHRWFIPGSPYSIDNLPKHRAFFKATKDYREVYFSASNQTGKSLRNGELVATPDGFAPVESLEVGDFVMGSDGRPTEVLGVFPQGKREVIRVGFNDGSTVDCDPEHLWTVRPVSEGKNSTFTTITTHEIMQRQERCGWAVPNRPVVHHNERDLPIDPYFLGLLMGDGGLSGNAVYITSADQDIVDYCRRIAESFDLSLVARGKYTYQFTSRKNNFQGHNYNILRDILDSLGLRGLSKHKRIPEEYKYASASQRLALLQGLMDADGACGTGGQATFYSVCKELCEDVADVVRSLGANATVNIKNGRYKGEHHLSHLVYIPRNFIANPFRLKRKAERFVRGENRARPLMMKTFESIGVYDCTCIRVAASDSLFLTRNYVPTHNTSAGVYASVLHLTGEYPDWWEGKRYDRPVVGWALGDTTVTVRNILQVEFLGKQGEGTGMIPASYIVGTTAKAGSSGSKEKIFVRHKSGGVSELSLYSYEQGRKFFQGVKLDFVFMDELPPASLYGEAIMRTISTNGIVYVTATPLDGLTPVVLNFYTKADFLPEGSELPGVVKLAREDAAQSKGKNGNTVHEEVADDGRSKAVIVASWDDAPWLTEQAKKEILDSVPENERESRSKGLPTMGSGTVYPLALEEIVVPDFPIPDHYKKVGGLDVGWNFTAAGWIAQDPDSGVCYLYSEYKRSKAEPIIHAEAIKRRGDWINIAVDPASLGRGQADGKQIFSMYKKHGVRCHVADNAVEAGIYKVWEMLSTGQLKIFKSCIETQKEYLTYRRDDKGRVIKENDHLMDGALRYPIMSLKYARQKPVRRNPNNNSGIASGLQYDI